MDTLIGDLECDIACEYPRLDGDTSFIFILRKQVLVRSTQRAFRIFDGGETVRLKIVDGEGTEYVQTYSSRPGDPKYKVKVQGRKPNIENMTMGQAARLGLLPRGAR